MSYNTALIVDDSKLARIALKKKLEKRGLQIVMAEGAKEALGVLQNTDVDIVFMDHLMPEVDGFEATQQIKSNEATAHVPVIMCSGKEKPGYLEEARAIGASNVLPKPAESEAIEAVFAQLEEEIQSAPASNDAAAEAPVTAQPQMDGADMDTLLQPIQDELANMAAALEAQSEELEARFAAANDDMKSLRKAVPEAVDVESLKSELLASVAEQTQPEEMLSALREDMHAQWQQDIEGAMGEARAEMAQQLEGLETGGQDTTDLDAALAELEQRLTTGFEARCSELLESRLNEIQKDWQDLVDALRGEIAAVAVPSAAEPVDVGAIKSALREELLAEMAEMQAAAVETVAAEPAQDSVDFTESLEDAELFSGQDEELAIAPAAPAPTGRNDLKWVTLLSLASALTAGAAIALHWF